MSLVSLPGGFSVSVGIGMYNVRNNTPIQLNNVTMDAANEAIIAIGHMATSDKGSHTINTTGSSSIGWRSGAVTFANAGTTVKVGIAPVDTTNGPPGRASHVTDVIAFDVSADFTGGGGGITMSKRVDISRNERETWVFECTIRDYEREPIDISDASEIAWRVADEDGETLLEATLGDGIEIASGEGVAGRCDIIIPYENHSDLLPGTYQHELLVTLASGEVTAQAHGTLTVEDSIFI